MAVTVTANVHVAFRRPSTAVHETFVEPGVKSVPLPGLHVTVTGPLPPLATGGVNVTGTGAPPVELA
jgi:hypothetical protein